MLRKSSGGDENAPFVVFAVVFGLLLTCWFLWKELEIRDEVLNDVLDDRFLGLKLYERIDLGMVAFQQAREALMKNNSTAVVLQSEKLAEALKIVKAMKTVVRGAIEVHEQSGKYYPECAVHKNALDHGARSVERLLGILSGHT